jgi:lactoylglutathione lyase
MSALETFPILSVAQLDRSTEFYGDLLGGEIDYRFPPDGEPQFVTLKLGQTTLGLGATTGAPDGPAGSGYTLCTYVADCDEAVERIRAAGHRVAEEPVDQPWGERTARVHDPDGYEVLLVARL